MICPASRRLGAARRRSWASRASRRFCPRRVRLTTRSAVRTGDTTQSERSMMKKHPPHILVTTPESLYILLTSESGREMLQTVRSVIVDEIHALAGNKRGAHLSLSLERLNQLCDRPPVRIGISATQKPIEDMALFLTGQHQHPEQRACSIVDTGHVRQRDLAIEMTGSPLEAVMANEAWDEIYRRLEQLIEQHRTTLIFVNTRRLAERGVSFRQAVATAPWTLPSVSSLLAGRYMERVWEDHKLTASLVEALRDDDRAILLELHAREAAALRELIVGDRRIGLHVRDCYEGLPALLPPRIRRGLVLIDPSYEKKSEYEEVVRLLERALDRWANGVFVLWYPLLPEGRDRMLLRQIKRLRPPKTLVSEYRFAHSAVGLQGSGLVAVNAPWQLGKSLTDAMQYVIDTVGSGTHSIINVH